MDHSMFITTPPVTPMDYDSADDSYIEDSYFLKTYVPLSSLPTPPMTSHSNGSFAEENIDVDCHGNPDKPLLGPAIHLSNLIPSSVSLTEPSINLVYNLLRSANLPLDTVALAVCILDSLNSRFALAWRRSCPLSTQDIRKAPQLHIDSVRPEVIILAALVIAVKFLDDQECPTRECSRAWASDMWTCEQINSTQNCIMQNLGYRILPLWTKDLIGDALGDMDRAGRQAGLLPKASLFPKAQMAENTLAWEDEVSSNDCGNNSWLGEQKPLVIETPMTENSRWANDVDVATRDLFSITSNSTTTTQDLVLRDLVARDPFSLYFEPVIG